MDGEQRAAIAVTVRGFKRPRVYWLERAREAGAAKVGVHIHRMALRGLDGEAIASDAFDDWMMAVEWRRPSAFRACARVERLLRAPFVEAFAAEVQEWLEESPSSLRFGSVEP